MEADINAKNRFLNTPIHVAILKDNLDIVKLLIYNNANVTGKNIFGLTSFRDWEN